MSPLDPALPDSGRRSGGRRAGRGRESVLAGVRRVIAQRGAERTRFSDVVAETGAALSTLQYSFGNREDMIIAALRSMNAREVQRVQSAIESIDDPAVRLRTFIWETLRAGASIEEAREGWLVWVEYWRSAARDEELAVEWRAAYEQWRGLLAPILSDGIEQERFTPAIDVEATITLTLALFEGLSVQFVLRRPDVDPVLAYRYVLSALEPLLGAPGLADEGSVS